jgi:hypothetical protein
MDVKSKSISLIAKWVWFGVTITSIGLIVALWQAEPLRTSIRHLSMIPFYASAALGVAHVAWVIGMDYVTKRRLKLTS